MPETEGYPELAVFCDGYQPHKLASAGTLGNPYRIATAEDIGAMHRTDWSACYKLVANIDLSGITWSCAPMVYFDGKFDGAGFALPNFTIQGGGYLGLFGFLGTHASVQFSSTVTGHSEYLLDLLLG